MEKIPDGGMIPENKQEKELPFNEQVELAKNLFKAVEDRNIFIERQGGFDSFADSGQYVESIKDAHDEMEEAIDKAKKEIDEKVSDKEGFVGRLKEAGENDLADLIAGMFGVSTNSKS